MLRYVVDRIGKHLATQLRGFLVRLTEKTRGLRGEESENGQSADSRSVFAKIHSPCARNVSGEQCAAQVKRRRARRSLHSPALLLPIDCQF